MIDPFLRFLTLENIMKIRHLLFSLTLSCSYIHACGLHQSTGFNFITEPGSLDVFASVIEARQANTFANVDSEQEISFSAFQLALTKPNQNKLNFALFQSTVGHYSDVTLSDSIFNPIAITDRQTLLNKDDLLLVSDIDVLDALARGVLSWQQAKDKGLVKINGATLQAEQLNRWFAERFTTKG